MKLISLLLAFGFASCGNTYYIVRHGEKAAPDGAMSGDVQLSDKGKERAQNLKEQLKNKKITAVYSTNTIRTKSTAQPTAEYFSLPVQVYPSRPDSAFINTLRASNKNTLIVGHSNTVDDVVNRLTGATHIPGDLPETEYDNLFIIKKKGSRYTFTIKKY